jgi:hypothetical protein
VGAWVDEWNGNLATVVRHPTMGRGMVPSGRGARPNSGYSWLKSAVSFIG